MQGMMGPVTCVAAHPLIPRIVVLCDSGDIHLWDYDLKVHFLTFLRNLRVMLCEHVGSRSSRSGGCVLAA